MVDFFALALSHGLLALAALRLLGRDDLDREGPAPPPRMTRGRRFGTLRSRETKADDRDAHDRTLGA